MLAWMIRICIARIPLTVAPLFYCYVSLAHIMHGPEDIKTINACLDDKNSYRVNSLGHSHSRHRDRPRQAGRFDRRSREIDCDPHTGVFYHYTEMNLAAIAKTGFRDSSDCPEEFGSVSRAARILGLPSSLAPRRHHAWHSRSARSRNWTSRASPRRRACRIRHRPQFVPA